MDFSTFEVDTCRRLLFSSLTGRDKVNTPAVITAGLSFYMISNRTARFMILTTVQSIYHFKRIKSIGG